ncbi:hypothetical protein NKJ11_05880 [Mesorhizobium sp. M0243]
MPTKGDHYAVLCPSHPQHRKFCRCRFRSASARRSRTAAHALREGAVRQVWNRGDIPGSGMMFEAADDAEVRGHLATLPLVKAGMMDIAAIVPLKPYPGFGPKH